MDKSRSSGIIKSASALLAVIIIVVVILLINQNRRIEEHHEQLLSETITYNRPYDERLQDFYSFADELFKERCEKIDVREYDYMALSAEEYNNVHISMWNIDALSPETFSNLFGNTLLYADYMFETPMELKTYLNAIFSSGNSVGRVYISIDPYILEKNYYVATHYDDEPETFEGYIHNEILTIFNNHPEVSFEMFLPARPVSYWASLTNEEYSEIMDKWYLFLMYLHWCPNAVVRYLGDVEWLVSNDSNYETPERFKDDIMKKAYLYLYAYEKYNVNAPELKQKKNTIDKFIRKEKNGDYNICDLSGTKIVFLGDSLFDYIKENSMSVPGDVSRLTGAECYNLAIGGTRMSAVDNFGFTRVANALAMKSVLDFDSRYKTESERFLADYSEGDQVLFVILYGMNDYFCCVPISNEDIVIENEDGLEASVYSEDDTFINSAKYGVELLKKSYPDAEILILTPYPPLNQKGGKEPYAEGGRPMDDYVEALKSVSGLYDIDFYDLYDEGPITVANQPEYLVDDAHLNEKGAFVLAESIAKFIGKTGEEDVSDN